jgi:hypothetical protein
MNAIIKAKAKNGDLRKTHSDFCEMWGCNAYTRQQACTYCSVLDDVHEMASGYHAGLAYVNHISAILNEGAQA